MYSIDLSGLFATMTSITDNRDMTITRTIKDNVSRIRDTVPDDVTIVAAAKTRTAAEISAVLEVGITVIGENYVQEARRAFAEIGDRASWHMIGHLQQNKVKRAIEMFDMIETVDSIALAERIDRECARRNRTMPVLIEVNSGREPQKAGVLPEETEGVLRAIARLSRVEVRGLMTMGPRFGDPEAARRYFRETRTLFERLQQEQLPHVGMTILSMGMSNTYRIAIEEGATMIRIGTLIFGEREHKR